MPTVVIMPALGMAQDTGKVLRWLRAEGDLVERGEPLVEIETDKTTVEIEAPATGSLAGVCAVAGDDVPVGEAIAWVLEAGESPPTLAGSGPREASETAAVETASASAPPVARGRLPLVSPKARRLAARRGIDLRSVSGSGPGGAIVAADLSSTADESSPRLSSVWRLMAARTTASWQSVPQFQLRRDVEATRLQSWLAAARTKPGSESVSISDLLVKVVAESLRRHPRLNSSWDNDEIVVSTDVNVALAVALDDGLVVPVIHDADRMSLTAIARRRVEVVTAARANKLRPADLAGGTFTISNLGMYGVDSFDAIVNAPQAAILAVGRIRDRIVPIDGAPSVRPVLQLSITFDHRVADGARGAAFLDTLASLIEEPAGLVE